MKKQTFAFLWVLSFAAISTSAQGNPLDESNSCIAALQGDPKIQILSAKLPYDIFSLPTLEMLANKSKPTPKEKVALSYLNVEREKCIDIGNEFRRNNLPIDVQALATAFRSDSVSTLADLYAGKMTYGDASKVRAKIAADFRINLDSLIQKYQVQDEIRQKQTPEAEDRKLSEERQARQLAEQRKAFAEQQQQALDLQRRQFQVQQEANAKAARQAQADQQFNMGLQLLNSARPQMPAPMLNNSFNCRSSTYGGVVTTNCN